MSELMTVTLGEDTFAYLPIERRDDCTDQFWLMGVEWNMAAVYTVAAGREPSFTLGVRETADTWLGGEPGENGWRELKRRIGLIGVQWKWLAAEPDTYDPRVPLIGADVLLNDGTTGHMIIDGWHRLARARQLGIETMLVVMLTTDEELKCRSARSYKPRRKRKAPDAGRKSAQRRGKEVTV